MAKSEAKDIHILEGIEAIRLRPGMYIGDADIKGLHHLINEVVDNAVDEHLAGNCFKIKIDINKNGSVSIEDDGCGIPIDRHSTGKSAVEIVFTKLHSGAKFGGDSPYKVSGGLHGVGVTAVNAVSKNLDVDVTRDGSTHRISFSRGVVVDELHKVSKASKNRHGTKVTFTPDVEIFQSGIEFKYDIVAKRCRELAFLNPMLKFILVDHRTNKKEEFYTKEGLKDFVRYLNDKDKNLLPDDPIAFSGSLNGTQADIAFQYGNSSEEKIETFCNNIHTTDGGTHLVGFKQAFTASLNIYLKQEKVLGPREPMPDGNDYREGLVAVISIKHPTPSFESQTKVKLVNPEIASIISTIVNNGLKEFFEVNPKIVRSIIQRASLSARARIAAKRARDNVKRKDPLSITGMPGKLADCRSNNNETTELFIVEGDSAGGSAKTGRDSEFQAILALRGKILNVERAKLSKIIKHKEIEDIIKATGANIGSSYDDSKRRYGKIIIMTDADIDGSHIRTLLLTFFYRYMPQIIKDGRLYAAQPPLFRLKDKKSKKVRYIISSDEKIDILSNWGILDSTLAFKDVVLDNKSFKKLFKIMVSFNKIDKMLFKKQFSFKWFVSNFNKSPRHALVSKDEIKILSSLEDLNNYLSDKDEIKIINDNMFCPKDLDKICIWSDLNNIYNDFVKLLNNLSVFNLGVDDIFNGNYTFEYQQGNKIKFDSLMGVFKEVISVGSNRVQVSRFKGLGEMDASELWDTTMDPEKRSLVRINIKDAKDADKIFRILMGEEVTPRREYIELNALSVENIDI